MRGISPTVKHLVLVGGGHSHLAVLRRFGMKPVPGLALTVISRDILIPYSGCLPGYLAGRYQLADMHIDLRPLAQFAGARLIHHEVTEIDLHSKQLTLAGRPGLPFDVLSLNIGSRPDSARIPGAAEYTTPIKPIAALLEKWNDWYQQIQTTLAEGGNFAFVIVGGGPASVELAFAVQHRISRQLQLDEVDTRQFKLTIVSADDEILALHNPKVRQFTSAELQRRHIELRLGTAVAGFRQGEVLCANGESLFADVIVCATGANLPDWPFACGLVRSEDGFISIRPTLQTISHDFVFASGDAATVMNEPRPKSGVYAVRQGKVLARNLQRFATGKSLQGYFPQRQALALISMGNHQAIASRGNRFFQGRSMGMLKHQLDFRFVARYRNLPAMPAQLELAAGLVDAQTEAELKQHAMRCAGCGAKVSAAVLTEVLAELESFEQPDVVQTAGGIEDASRIRLPDGRILLQSVDYLRAFVNDPWLFARIATVHCLSDIHAMGVQPHSALAMVGLPHASKRYSRQQLRELMQGCQQELTAAGCALTGGHSAESEELQFGLCVNGFAAKDAVLSKDKAKAGDVIILTKPLGTGTLLAADMRHLAQHDWMEQAFASMLQANGEASSIIVGHGANACTDITGFGLAGHLLEMIEASNCNARLELAQIMALAGAQECLAGQIVSSLHQDNRLVLQQMKNYQGYSANPKFELLFDPQTAGGLLFTMAGKQASSCLSVLHKAGYTSATIIGQIIEPDDKPASITLN